MDEKQLTLGEFIQLIQSEVQKSSEYLAREEVRRVMSEAPSKVIFTVEKIMLQIPVDVYIRATDEGFIERVETLKEPQRILERGYIKVPLIKKEKEAGKLQYNLVVECRPRAKEEEKEKPAGIIEVTLLPVSKR